MPEEEKKNHNIFLYIIGISCFVIIGVSFYSFYYKQKYDFLVETSCDNTTETCFYRDCLAENNECPPNEFSYYNMYTIQASDFKACTNGNCAEACKRGTISCIKTECSESDTTDGTCTLPQTINN